MVKFRKGGYAERILIAVAISGEFPYRELDLLGDRKMLLRNLNKLKEEKYVTVKTPQKAPSEKTIRLMTKAFPILEEINPLLLDNYMKVSGGHHFRGTDSDFTQIWRRHRMAEVVWFLARLGVGYAPWERPQLSLDGKDKNHKVINPDDCLFYTSVELKNADKNQRYKTEFTRILGTLFSPGGIYNIYNTNKGLMKWNQQGENKAQVLVEDIIRINYNSEDAYDMHVSNAIMFGKDFDTAIQILESNGGKRDNNNFEMLSFDNTYDNIYYITLDDNGHNQIGMMMTKDWHAILKSLIFQEYQINFSYSSVDCDAIDGDTYYLLMFDGNIGRLKRFKEASFDSDKQFQIICFDFQTAAIERYIGNENNITVSCCTVDSIMDIFYDE